MKLFNLILVMLPLTVSSSFAQTVTFDATLDPAGSFTTEPAPVEGKIVKGSGDHVSADKLVVELDKVKTGISMRDGHMREKYLDTKKYPNATMTDMVGDGGKFKGKLTVRDKTKDVEGTYKIEGETAKAEFEIKVSDFGISPPNYHGVGLEDGVKLHVDAPLTADTGKAAEPAASKPSGAPSPAASGAPKDKKKASKAKAPKKADDAKE